MQTRPLTVSGDILVLAGDILPLRLVKSYAWFLDWVSDNYKQAYWICGNHEYYHHFIDDERSSFCEPIRSNLFLLNNHSIEISPDAVIQFTTMWSRIGKEYRKHIQTGMSDFFCIKYRDELITTDDYNGFHSEAVNYLEAAFEHHRKKTSLVVTHHVPTFKNYPPIYIDSPLNQGFAVEMKEHIERWSPDYWIYGHSHFNTNTFKMKGTTLLTNQLGYTHLGEDTTFNHRATISL